jgi:DNA-binding CsgD family transcriptional regulator
MAETAETRLPSPRELQAVLAAERTGLPFLVWRDAAGQQHVLLLTHERERVTVGRRDGSDVLLTGDPEVSRTHALLEPVGEEWTLIDDGLSRNGSFINGSRLNGRRRLHDRDRMCFGRTPVTFHAPATREGSASTARAADTPAVPLTETQRKVLRALCRPIVDGSATPATNPQIAAEVYLSVDAVKAHLRVLFDRFELGELPQNEKRSRLVSAVMSARLLAPHDF